MQKPSGQSYKATTIVFNKSRVINIGNLLVSTTVELYLMLLEAYKIGHRCVHRRQSAKILASIRISGSTTKQEQKRAKRRRRRRRREIFLLLALEILLWPF